MSSELKVDTISEKTSANGVTIDSLLIKDGLAYSGIMQVVTFGPIGGSSNQLETTSTTYADVPNHTISITPKVATSKIFVYMTTGYWAADVPGNIKIVENSSGSFVDVHEMKYQGMSAGQNSIGGNTALGGLIDHNTTNAITIKLQGARQDSSGSNRFRITWYDQEAFGIAVEIGAI